MAETLCLESILSHVEPRRVNNDYTIAWTDRRWQIPKTALRPGLRGATRHPRVPRKSPGARQK